MKAISLWQPWAQACVTGDKRFETRSRRMNYRGVLAIHATQKFDPSKVPLATAAWLAVAWGEQWAKGLAFGAVIGEVTVTDCHFMDYDFIESQSHAERLLGDWRVGRWAYRLSGARMYDRPIPASGQRATPWNWSQ